MENINKSVIFSRTGRHTQKYLQDLQFTQEPRRRKQRKTKERDASSSQFLRALKEEWSVYVQTDFLKTQEPWCRTSYPKRGFRKRRGGSKRSPDPQRAWLSGSWKESTAALCFPHLDFRTFSVCQLLVESYLLSVLIVICLTAEADYLYLLCSPTSSDWTFNANKGYKPFMAQIIRNSPLRPRV